MPVGDEEGDALVLVSPSQADVIEPAEVSEGDFALGADAVLADAAMGCPRVARRAWPSCGR